jgi:segregation and condensation protein B
MAKQKDIARTAQIVEAMIFASREPVQEKLLEKQIPDGMTLKDVLGKIADRYNDASGIELAQVGQSWAFRTKADVAAMLNVEKDKERPLSRAALETVSIIAYHQPITRAEIEEIRGVSTSRGTMDILLELGWIKPRGRRRTPGRPLTWGTTEDFLDHFGLEDISALPGLEELKQAGLLRMAQSISDANGGLSDLLAPSEEDEGEEEAGAPFDDEDLVNLDDMELDDQP